jgi:hypothetical protein
MCAAWSFPLVEQMTFCDSIVESLCNLCVLRCLCGEPGFRSTHHGDTEDTEVAQRKSKIGCTRKQLSQHIRQNPAVLVVIDLDRCVDAQNHEHFIRGAVRTMNH